MYKATDGSMFVKFNPHTWWHLDDARLFEDEDDKTVFFVVHGGVDGYLYINDNPVHSLWTIRQIIDKAYGSGRRAVVVCCLPKRIHDHYSLTEWQQTQLYVVGEYDAITWTKTYYDPSLLQIYHREEVMQ